MSKKRVLIVLGIIIAVLVMIFLFHTIKNYMIITDLQSKISQYSNSTNYHSKYVTTEESGVIVTTDYYRKGNKKVVFIEKNSNGKINKVSMYANGEKTNIYTSENDTKTAQLNTKTTIAEIKVVNQLETTNKWQTFIGGINTKVKSVTYKGKECYDISKFVSGGTLTFEGEMYIEKDTGLLVKMMEGTTVSEREQEFNNVDDSIFVEPDISQYKVQENN